MTPRRRERPASAPPLSVQNLVLRSGAGGVLLPLSAIVTGPLIARALGPEGRGLMAALLAPVSLANLMFTFGLPESLNYHLARGRLSIRGAVRASVLGGALAGLTAAAVVFVAAPALLHDYPDAVTQVRLLGLTLPITIAFAAYRGAWQGRRRVDRINRERVLGVLSRLLILVLLVALGDLTPENAAWVSVLCGILGSLVLLRGLDAAQPRGNEVRLRSVYTYAAAASVGTLGGFLVLRLDQTLLTPLAGARELGFYAVAVSLAELPLSFVTGIRDTVATVAADTDDPAFAGRTSRLTVAALLPVSALGCLVAPVAIPLLFGQAFTPAVLMTQILFAGCVASGAAAVLGAGLMAAGRPGLRSLCQGLGALATVPLLLVLVPVLGGRGAALATALTYVLLAGLMAVLLARSTAVGVRECLVPRRSDYQVLGRGIRGAARRPRGTGLRMLRRRVAAWLERPLARALPARGGATPPAGVTSVLLCIYRARNADAVRRLVHDAESGGTRCALWALDELIPDLAPSTLGTGPGARPELLSRLALLADARATDYTVLCDDDLEFRVGCLAELLARVHAGGFVLAQPSHTRDSLTSYSFGWGRLPLVARSTEMVEIGPVVVVRKDFHDRVFPMPAHTGMGWGTEVLWHAARRLGERFAIVDVVRIRHLGAIAADYATSEEEQHRLEAVLAEHGLSDTTDLARTTGRWYRWQARPPWADDLVLPDGARARP